MRLFSGRRQSSSALLTVFGVALVAAIIAATAGGIWRLHEEALLDAEQELASINHALVEQTSSTVGSIDLVLMSTVEWLQGMTRARAVGEESMHQQLRARLSGLPQIRLLAVYRPDGSLKLSSLYFPTPPLNNYEDPYFVAHRDHAGSGLYVALPRKSRLEDNWYLFFSRAIRGPGGRFEGVLMALVDPGYFADSYRRLKLRAGSSVALVRGDDYLLARYPALAEKLGMPVDNGEFNTRLLAEGGHAIMRMPGAGGGARIVSGEMVPGYPLRMHVSLTEEAALAEWRGTALALAAAAAGATLMIVLLLLGLRRHVRHEEALARSLRDLNEDLEQRVRERTAKLEVANKELETFTYSVSHDLKAPLRGIDGYSRLLLDEYSDKLDGEGRRFLHNVRQAAQHMGQLIDDLLAYARLERSDVEVGEIDLRALIALLLAERADEIEARSAAVSVAVCCTVVSADRDGLAMALRNLLENALKFSRDAAHPAIEIAGRDAGTACILSVRDNGTGFDMKYHDRIFAMFQRLHRSEDYPGTGIGLAIVAKAMARMGGRAWAESEPGRGAIFYLEIPK